VADFLATFALDFDADSEVLRIDVYRLIEEREQHRHTGDSPPRIAFGTSLRRTPSFSRTHRPACAGGGAVADRLRGREPRAAAVNRLLGGKTIRLEEELQPEEGK
jgi:hypothetical protein